jgi:hypothetical protein
VPFFHSRTTRLLVGACLAAISLTACRKSSPQGPTVPDPAGQNTVFPARDATPLTLMNFGATIAPLDSALGQAGDLFVTPVFTRPFGEFGRTVRDPSNNPKLLPTFDFTLAADAPIVSAVDGVVTRVFDQGDDKEILISRSSNASWFVSYDHVVNLQVSEGATVRVGQTLAFGVPAVADYRNGAGRRAAFFEFMIVNQDDGLARCPIDYLDASLRDTYRARLQQLMQQLEAFYNNPAMYDEASMVQPGCLSPTVRAG